MKKVIGIIAVLLLLLSIIGMCTNSNEHIDDNTDNIEKSNTEISSENSTQNQENIDKDTSETASDNTNKKEDSVCLHSNTVIKNSSSATCTEDGYTGDTYCKDCDTVINKGSTIKATGHDTEIRNKKDATSTTEGYTGDTYCINCKTVIKNGEKIPKVENTTSEIVYITETGTKYHSRKSCPGLSRANAIYETTLEKAQKQGFTPCSKCH